VLAAPPARVFEALTSPDIVPLVDPSVRAWVPDTLPIGVGTRFSIRGRIGHLPFRATSEVSAWDPPRHAAFRAVRPAWPLAITADHRCAGDAGGAGGTTRYTWTIAITGPRPAVALAALVFERVQGRQATALHAHLGSQGSRGTNR
jgi:uncharacterized protein YndB with AHSA1/START domain